MLYNYIKEIKKEESKSELGDLLSWIIAGIIFVLSIFILYLLPSILCFIFDNLYFLLFYIISFGISLGIYMWKEYTEGF